MKEISVEENLASLMLSSTARSYSVTKHMMGFMGLVVVSNEVSHTS